MACFVPARSRSEVSCVHPQRSVHTSCFPESPHIKVLLPARQLWDHRLLIRGHYGERRLSFNQLTVKVLLLFYSTILLKSVIIYCKKREDDCSTSLIQFYLISLFQYVLKPTFTKQHISGLDKQGKLYRAYDGTTYLPGIVGLNNIKANDYANVVLQVRWATSYWTFFNVKMCLSLTT